MSSPLAKSSHSKASRLLISGHQKLSHNRRTEILAKVLSQNINSLLPESKRCIDIGCGDMSISELIATKIPGSKWHCLDIYALPAELAEIDRWQKYLQIDGSQLPFMDQSVDVALFCDVLHHMPIDVQERMLKEAGRVAKYVVIKDHFEYGLWSRTCLRLMDFIGNWAYGVSVPKQYFDRTKFAEITERANLKIHSIDIGIHLYSHIPVARHILQEKWQFIAVMSHCGKNIHLEA